MNTITEIPRDRWGRPLIQPEGGGKPEPYTRCTTYVGCLEDTYNLSRWQQRNVAIGLSMRPDLVLKAASERDNKDALNEVCEQASEAASASAAATTGTALHKLTEQLDRGTLDLNTVPKDYLPDLDAYRKITAEFTIEEVECFGVLDGLKVAGTADRIVEYKGERYIADLKTGSSMDFGRGKIAMQLAVYSRMAIYDPATQTRTSTCVDRHRGIVIHLPAGTGKASLFWVDLEAGWGAVEIATTVRNWRATEKTLFEPFATARGEQPDHLLEQINTATDAGQLNQLWAQNAHTWKEHHTQAAKQRKKEITRV